MSAGVLGQDLRVAVHQHPSHLGVGEPGVAADDRPEQLRPLHPSLAVDLQERRPGQAVGPRLEAADAGGERRGQHGQGPVREIDAGAAGIGLAVQTGATGHVVGDVGDGDVQPVAIGGPLDADGIVEVTGGFAVDGEGRERAQVPASGEAGGIDARAVALRLLPGLLREVLGPVVAEDHRLRLHLGVVGRAQQPLEPRLGSRVSAAVAGHLHRRHLAGECRPGARQRDRGCDARVHGHQQGAFSVGLDHAHEAALSPLQHFHHVPLAVAVALLLRPHQHPVAVHHPPHLPAAEVDVLHPFLIGDHETEAVGMSLDHSGHDAGGLGEGVVVLVETDDLALVDQFVERIQHRFPCRLAEPLAYLTQAEAVSRAVQHEREDAWLEG